MNIPGFLLQHTVTVERYAGDSAYGPTYAAAETVACFIDDVRRLVRNAAGDEVTAEGRFFCRLDVAEIPAESRVTVNGRTTTVITTSRRDPGGLPAPGHWEVTYR